MEEWRKVSSIEGYEISSIGRVRSLKRSNMLLTEETDYAGYKYVWLWNSANQTKFHALIHRLVAQAFIPNPENKPQVNHIDGNKSNNQVENLEWCTSKENVHHSYSTGLAHIGVHRHNSKLTKDQVIEIRKRGLDKSETYESMAKRFGIDASSIHDAAVGNTYRDVDYPFVPKMRPISYDPSFVQMVYKLCINNRQHVVGRLLGLPQQTISKLYRQYKIEHNLPL